MKTKTNNQSGIAVKSNVKAGMEGQHNYGSPNHNQSTR